MASGGMRTASVSVGDAALEVLTAGSGEPVVFVPTALTADEFVPVATDPALAGYRRIVYHRRGYGGSDAAEGPGSIRGDAEDCAGLMAALGIERAHLVGVSFSGAIALQLAADAPGRVHSLTLIEPPPVHVASASEFRSENTRLIRLRRTEGLGAALDEFLSIVIGDDWRERAERLLPGSSGQMERDAGTFFDTDLPALLDWSFGAAEVARVECPLLYVGGTDSGPWFAEVRDLMLDWFPDAEEVVVDGADHALALTHASTVARSIADFLGRHPLR